MSKNVWLEIRGDVQDALGIEDHLFLVTQHPEDHPGFLYRLNGDKLSLESWALPKGGTHLAALGKQLFAVGGDNKLYTAPVKGGAPKALKVEFSDRVAALRAARDTLVVAHGSSVVFLDEKGKPGETVTVENPVTALAADPSGDWLVLGTAAGELVVLDREEKKQFTLGDSQKVHDGKVTGLVFENEELRVISAGADVRLKISHVRGALESEERSGRGMHDNAVNSLLIGPYNQRLITGADEASIKTWRLGRSGRPASSTDGVGRTRALALVTREKRTQLVQACGDTTLRWFAVGEDDKLGDRTLLIRGAYAKAARDLNEGDPKARQAAIAALESYADQRAIDLLHDHVISETDHKLRLRAVQAIATTGHARANSVLEGFLKANQEAVRLEALAGLRTLEGETSLRPLHLALNAGHANIGVAATAGLEALAKKDDQAQTALVSALDYDLEDVRNAAFDSLERLFPKKSPEASLLGLSSRRGDMRQKALIRLMQRSLLGNDQARTAIRTSQSDSDAHVRQTGRLVAVLGRPKLAEVLRSRDKDIHRALYDLEHHGVKNPPALPKVKAQKPDGLKAEDLAPLLEALSSRQRDTALFGASGLATLEDSRAFGALLQLSRENDTDARAQVCRALQVLGEPRSGRRLRQMLRDPEEAVRDAAFTALSKLLEPVDAARAGLLAEFADVRKRALRLVTRLIRKGKGKPDPAALALLSNVLNDDDSGLRSEAFKAAVNLGVGSDEPGTLRFVLGSIHHDVRREVLVECMGRMTEPWARPLLLELFEDPDSDIRSEAFVFTMKKTRGKSGLDVLRAALTCSYPDLRIAATEALAKRKEDGAQLLLNQALEDTDNTVRQLAVDALAQAEAWDALTRAMSSEYANVRLRAATARAELGDDHALEPLLAEATAERPTFEDQRELWAQYVLLAVSGLQELGHKDAIPRLRPLLQYEEPAIRNATAWAIAWSADPEHRDTLLEMLRHEDGNVRYFGAIGLSFVGDEAGLPELYRYLDANWDQRRRPRMRNNRISPDPTFLALLATLSIGPSVEDKFLAFMDHGSNDIHQRAFLMGLLLELGEAPTEPTRLLSALSSAHPWVRLTAARGVERWSDPEAFEAWALHLFNHRGEHVKPGTFTADDLGALAATLAHSAGHPRMRFASVLWYLNDFDDEDHTLERNWRVLSGRFSKEVKTAIGKVGKRKKPAKADVAAWSDMVIGALVGLSREPGYRAVGVRQHALRSLGEAAAGAKKGSTEVSATEAAYILALADTSGDVRKQAFEGLVALGTDPARIAAEALATGLGDVGTQALELLTEAAKEKEAIAILGEVLQNRTDDLAYVAYRLLSERSDEASALELGLEARWDSMREYAVSRLQSIAGGKQADKLIESALQSRYQQIRFAAAGQLARLRDARALPVLETQLASDNANQQNNAATGLASIGSPEAVAMLVARHVDDKAGTANNGAIFGAIGRTRRVDALPLLLPLLELKKRRGQVFDAALKCTGYDQYISDPDDTELSDRSWLTRQQFRSHEGLAQLAETLLSLGDTGLLAKLVGGLRWCPEAVVDPVLATMARSADEGLRHRALEAVGFRAEKRSGPVDTLVDALAHHDTQTRFLAAEGLSRVGRNDGVAVLLTAVTAFEELHLRKRAVIGLGKIADERALDTLVDIASDEDHLLYEEAVEAAGHLGTSARGEEILGILKKRLKRDDAEAAVRGLRWFGTADAWDLIREAAKHDDWCVRQEVALVLQHDPHEGGTEVLEKLLLEDDDWDVANQAVTSLRERIGHDNVEVDYMIARSPWEEGLDGRNELDKVFESLARQGTADRLLSVAGNLNEETAEVFGPAIRDIILALDPLPVKEATAQLDGEQDEAGRLAAIIVGRAGDKLDKKAKKALETATATNIQRWKDARQETWGQQHPYRPTAKTRLRLSRVERLIWACGRAGVGAGVFEELMETALADPHATSLARQVLLSSESLGKKALPILEAAIERGDADLRTAAAEMLRRLDAKKASARSADSLNDPTAFARLVVPGETSSTIEAAASNVHQQGIVLPALVAAAQAKALGAVAADNGSPVNTRLGAIEALSALASADALAAIRVVAANEDNDEELRKAAWRALRRGKRRAAGTVARTL